MADVLAQVLTRAQAEAYRQTRTEAGIDPLRISGFAVALADVRGLAPAAILELTRAAGHPGTSGEPVHYDTDPLALLVFANGPDVRACTTTSAASVAGGPLASDAYQSPWTGTGLLATRAGQVAAEYVVQGSALLPLGAELWAVNADQSWVVARLGVGADSVPVWQAPDAPDAAVALRQPGEHQLFAEIAGRVVPALQVGEDAVGVLAPDSRAAWLCYPAASEYTDTPLGCLAIYPLREVDAILRLETRAPWDDRQVLVESVGEETVSVLYQGPPLPGLVEAGFQGDQYHGFRATLARSSVGRLEPEGGRYEPGARPARTAAAAAFCEGENRRFHVDFLSQPGLAPLPVWWAPDAAGVPRPVVKVPDRRAALLMAPGAGELWSDGDGGILVPVDPALLVQAATAVTAGDGAEYVVEGSDGTHLVGWPAGVAATAPRLIAAGDVVRRDDALFSSADGR